MDNTAGQAKEFTFIICSYEIETLASNKASFKAWQPFMDPKGLPSHAVPYPPSAS